MSWENAEKAANNAGGGGKYIRLKDGEEVVGVFIGEPKTYYKRFKDKTRYDNYADGRTLKFAITFLKKEGSEFKSYIFEQGVMVLKELIEMKKEYGLDLFFKIKRNGSTKDDTVYHLLPKNQLTEQELKEIQDIKPLSHTTEGEESPLVDDSPPPSDDDMQNW